MNTPKRKIVVIDDERNIQTTLSAILERRGYEVVSAYNGHQGSEAIANHSPDLALLDLGLPDTVGLDFLKKIRVQHPALPIIVVTANDTLNNAIESIKIGAFHFISKPYVPEELLNLVSQALEQSSLRSETLQLREEATRLKKKIEQVEGRALPVFKNQKMVELSEMIEQVAPSEANALLVGESGVGKEVLANLLHSKSTRCAGPMVKLNCAAFPQHLIEGELFGYKKGAFTGALHDFPGMLSASSGGTLFLDEIAEMPIELQTRFLRVLQEREYRPLGSTQTHKADFRLIAASNRNPEEAIRSGKLREDLYYRLNTFTFTIPPLRERTDEIVDLCDQFLKNFGQKLNKANVAIAPETYEILLQYTWPGNVRELQNVIERAVVLAKNGRVTPDNLPPELFKIARNASGAPGSTAQPLSSTVISSESLNLEDCEKAAIASALERSHGNKKKAAEILGIHRPTLYAKMKKYGLIQGAEATEE